MKVLAIGAHPDDIELGCGGTLLAHRAADDDVSLLVMTSGEAGPQESRSRVAEQDEAAEMLGADLYWGGFEDGHIPDDQRAVHAIDALLGAIDPDVIYTHAPHDTHQDHRATATASIAAGRRTARVLCYESPTSIDFSANFYTEITGLVEAKLHLLRCHMSQVLACTLVDLEAVEAQARFRGFSGRVRHAEAFALHRYTWSPVQARRSPATGDVCAMDEALVSSADRALVWNEAEVG